MKHNNHRTSQTNDTPHVANSIFDLHIWESVVRFVVEIVSFANFKFVILHLLTFGHWDVDEVCKVNRNEAAWGGMRRNEAEWCRMNRTKLLTWTWTWTRTVVDCGGLCCTVMDCTGLCWIGLDVPDRGRLCWTVLDCAGLWRETVLCCGIICMF